MTSGATRFAAFCLALALLFGGLALMPVAALAVPFKLTPGSLIEPCNPGSATTQPSCFAIDTSVTWPLGTSFNIDYGTPAGGLVPFEITNLYIPDLLISQDKYDEIVITSAVTGTLTEATGFMEFDFSFRVDHYLEGSLQNSSIENLFSMSTGSTGPVDCNGATIPSISGFNLGAGANPDEAYLVGQDCLDLRLVGAPSSDDRLVGMSLRGTPEPSTLILVGTGLAGLAGMGRRRA